MNEFKTIDDLNLAFVSGKFKLDSQVVVEGTSWSLFETSPYTIIECLHDKHPMVVYINENNSDVLVFAWQTNSRGAIQPSGATTIHTKQGEALIKETPDELIIETDGEKITIRPDQLVGDVVRVSFTGLSNPKELQGKIDTGATVSSLHADNYKINGSQISFVCSPLSPNTITVPLKTQHAVKSPDGGTVYRPVIELDVKINGKLLHGAMFNLNDRSNMEQPVLVGQNILQAGKFYVDPTRVEGVSRVDWNTLNEHANIVPLLCRNINEDVLNAFYAEMLESDITFKELIQHVRREVIKTFEDTE